MPRKGILDGIKVANFSWTGAGPLSIRYLGAHGATVVRVESHTRPDVLRPMMPFVGGIPHVDKAPWFAEVNNSSLSLSIDLSKSRAREIAWRLIKWADVMAESFSPGVMKRWDLDYESVSRVRPDIIYFSSSQMGQSGPRTRFAGTGYQATAAAGITYVSGWPDRDPSRTQSAYTDFIAPRFGALAVVAALLYRGRTGKGQYLDQAQLEAACHFLAPPILDYTVNNRITERNGNSLLHAAPHSVYPCKGDERWCAIAVFTDEEWQSFCGVLGYPAWTKNPDFATLLGRKAKEDELNQLVAEWTIQHSADQVETMMQLSGISASEVQSTRDLFEDAHIKEQGFLRSLKHSVMGAHTYRGLCFRLSKSPDRMFAGPALGEHNDYILRELLRMTDDEIAHALEEHAVTTEEDLPEFRGGL